MAVLPHIRDLERTRRYLQLCIKRSQVETITPHLGDGPESVSIPFMQFVNQLLLVFPSFGCDDMRWQHRPRAEQVPPACTHITFKHHGELL